MFIAFEDINLFSFHCFLHFPLFLFTLKQREMTGETTALSFFGCVQTHIHTKEIVFTAAGVVRVIMTGGLFCCNLTNKDFTLTLQYSFHN